jgi:hypothetical protein
LNRITPFAVVKRRASGWILLGLCPARSRDAETAGPDPPFGLVHDWNQRVLFSPSAKLRIAGPW